MPKIVKYEIDTRIYEVEITEEQLNRLNGSNEGWDEVMDAVCDNFEFVKIKDKTDFEIIE
jgi:hypothetical protein